MFAADQNMTDLEVCLCLTGQAVRKGLGAGGTNLES